MKVSGKRLSRRNFLLAVGAGGAATAAAIAVKNSNPTTSSSGKRATRGYHATEHVNNYYRTTKV
jgi:shikimate 5-dehydrogenase